MSTLPPRSRAHLCGALFAQTRLAFIICSTGADDNGDSDLTRGMVGDINLFFHEIHDDDSEDGDSTTPAPTDGAAALPRRLAAEFNIMIADAAHRRRGLAREAVLLLTRYALEALPMRAEIARFEARLDATNHASRRLFERLGFSLRRELAVFGQIELAVSADGARATVAAAESAFAERSCPPRRVDDRTPYCT